MKFIAAVVFLCIGGNCQQQKVVVDQKACSFGQVQVKVPNNGEWQEGRVGIRCEK